MIRADPSTATSSKVLSRRLSRRALIRTGAIAAALAGAAHAFAPRSALAASQAPPAPASAPATGPSIFDDFFIAFPAAVPPEAEPPLDQQAIAALRASLEVQAIEAMQERGIPLDRAAVNALANDAFVRVQFKELPAERAPVWMREELDARRRRAETKAPALLSPRPEVVLPSAPAALGTEPDRRFRLDELMPSIRYFAGKSASSSEEAARLTKLVVSLIRLESGFYNLRTHHRPTLGYHGQTTDHGLIGLHEPPNGLLGEFEKRFGFVGRGEQAKIMEPNDQIAFACQMLSEWRGKGLTWSQAAWTWHRGSYRPSDVRGQVYVDVLRRFQREMFDEEVE